MGEIIVRKVRGMNWMMKISLVLVFTVMFSTFMYQGWYKPKKSEAAIANLKPWSNVYSGTSVRPGTYTYDVPAGTMGNSRMLVVAVSSAITPTSTAQTCAVSYGGQSLTPVASNFATSSRFHTALFYLLDSGIQSATTNQLTVTLSATGTQWTSHVDAAVFEGVNQAAPASSQSWLNNGTATTAVGPFAANLTIATGDLAVEAVAITRTGSATPRTVSTWATNWSSAFGPTTIGTTGASTNFYMAQDTTAGNTTSRHTASNTTNGSMSAMSIGMLPMNLQVGNGTTLGTSNAGQGTVDNVLDSFSMAASAGGVTVNTLTLTGNTNFTTANIAGVSVYRDNGTPGVLDVADVLVPTTYSAITTNATTITFTTAESVATTENFLITVDIAAASATGVAVTGRITAATGTIGTPTYGDSASATLNLQTAPGLTIGNNTNPADGPAGVGSQNNPLDGFTLQTVNVNGGTAAIDTLTVTGSANFTAANISGVHVYVDNGTAGTLDGADTLAPSTATAVAGNASTLTFSPPLYVTNTAKSYLVVVDVTAGATLGQTFTGRVTAATGHGLATPTYGDTNSATLTIKLNAKVSSCGSCHTYPPTDATGATPARNTPTGAVVGDHEKHNYVCSTCHVAPATETSADYGHRNGNIEMQAAIAGGTYARGTSFAQTNSSTSTTTCSNISCHGGNNPTPQWGIGTAGCVDCHSAAVTALKASSLSGGTVTQRDQVNGTGGEFGLAWGHKKTGRGTVANADCIVCHLEGDFTTQKPASYHGDGYIDLRDPDNTAHGNGEVPIYDMSGNPFRFVQFSTSYAAGSRTSDGHTSNNIDNVLTQKFCLACHDSDGATNTSARSNNGGTGTAAMPFGGIALGANYTATNGAIGTQGLIDVKTQFTTTFSSVHPVRGPLNRDFPTAARLAAPYNNQVAGRVDAGGVKTLSVVMNCFDCHNTPTTPLTTRTVAAHGNAATLRGNVYTNPYTLCQVCHTGYTVADNHGAGSAMAMSTGRSGEGFNSGCYSCHGDSGDTDANTTPTTVRPVRAQGYHGFDKLAGTGTTWPGSGTKPYAFIRNTTTYGGAAGYHTPRSSVLETLTAGGAAVSTCGGDTGCAGNGSARAYTPGGQY